MCLYVGYPVECGGKNTASLAALSEDECRLALAYLDRLFPYAIGKALAFVDTAMLRELGAAIREGERDDALEHEQAPGGR